MTGLVPGWCATLPRWWGATMVGLMVALGSASAAVATPRLPPVIQVPANAAGECLSSGQVWLVVVTDTGATLANRCVGRPANGMAALQGAGLPITFAPGGYICTLGGYPSSCPTTYDGRFWHYYHSTNGSQWSFADTGPAGYRYPASGMIDGWCYNAAGASNCTPPKLSVVAPPTQAPTTTKPTTAKPTTAKPTTAKPTTAAKPTGPTPPTATTGEPATSEASTKTTSPPSASSSAAGSSPAPSEPVQSNPTSPASSPATPSAATPSSSTTPRPVTATPSSGGPWGVIGTGAVLVTGALAWAGWRRIRHL